MHNRYRNKAKKLPFQTYLFWLALLCICFPFFSNAQFTQTWDDFYGGSAWEELKILHDDGDGVIHFGSAGYTFTGDPPTNNGNSDYWMFKTNYQGDIVWQHVYGGNEADILQSAEPTPDGGFILSGFSFSDATGDKTEPNRGVRDMWVVKVDGIGQLEWEKTLGGDTLDYASTAIPTNDGGYLIGGWTASTISGDVSEASRGGIDTDFWIVKLNAIGEKQWDRRYGGERADLIQRVIQTSDGGFLLAGTSNSDISGEKTENSRGSVDYWIVKIDAVGNIMWDRTFGGIYAEESYSIIRTVDGNYLIGGYSESPISGDKTSAHRGGRDFWLVKIAPDGTFIWDKSYGGTDRDEMRNLRTIRKNNIALIGFSGSNISADKTEDSRGMNDYWVVITNQEGDILSQKTLGGTSNDNMYDAIQVENGALIVGGFTFSDTGGDITDVSNGFQDNWVVRLDCDLQPELGNDTTICQFYPVFLDADDPDADVCNYTWNDGFTGSSRTVFPADDTFYSVTITDNFGCTAFDTIFISTIPTPVANLGTDYAICEDDSTALFTDSLGIDIIWSTGETTDSIFVQTTGDYAVTLTNSNTCFSSDTIHIEVNPRPVFDLGADIRICPEDNHTFSISHPGPIYEWSPVNTTSSFITVQDENWYYATVTNSDGCSTIDSVQLIHHPSPVVDLGPDTTICSNESLDLDATIMGCMDCTYFWDDNSTNPIRTINPAWTQSYSVTVTDGNSCTASDNIMVFVNTAPTIDFGMDQEICEGDSTQITFAISGTGPFNLTLNDGSQDTLLSNIWGGQTFKVSPGITTTYTLVSLEDNSIPRTCFADLGESLTLTVYTNETTNLSFERCEGDSLFVQNAWQKEEGVYFDTLSTIRSCDSVIITELIILDLDTTIVEMTTCNEIEAGSDTLFLSNFKGCDSLVITNTSLLPSDTLFRMDSTCIANEAGLDTLFLKNQYDCDSLVITETTLLPSDTIRLLDTTCVSTEAGFDTLFLSNQFSCDSLVITETLFFDSDTINLLDTSCDVAQAGLDTVFLFNQYGCDSLVITEITYIPPDTLRLLDTTCVMIEAGFDTMFLFNQYGCDSLIITETTFFEGNTIVFNENTCFLNEAGFDTLFLLNQYGCDSLIVTETTFIPPDTSFNTIKTSCFLNEAGFDTLFLSNQYGCDSLAITETVFTPPDTIRVDETSCFLDEIGFDTLFFINQYGCDSLIITETTLLPSDTIRLIDTTCVLTEAGLDTLFLSNQFSCDSLVITETLFFDSDTINLLDTSCDITQAGLDTVFLFNQYGCDSLVVTETTYIPPDTLRLDAMTCEQEEAGFDTLFLSNQYGCDSLVITETTFFESDTLIFNETTCLSNEAGSDTLFLSNQYGCDSLIITETTFIPPDTSFTTTTSCQTSEVGFDTLFLSNQYGCDSLAITEITFNPADTTKFDEVSCFPEEVGFDTLFLSNQYGCDSLVITETALVLGDTLMTSAPTCDISEAGFDTLSLQNQYGCDSLIITEFVYFPGDTIIISETTCNPDEVGVDTMFLMNEYGCDSLRIINTALLPSNVMNLTATSCDPAEVGIDSIYLVNQWGCDSLVITSTSFVQSDTIYLLDSSCDSTQIGIDTLILVNQAGCDSLVITEISLLPTDTTLINETTCDETLPSFDIDTLSNQWGCDSFLFITREYLPSDTTYLMDMSCNLLEVGIDTTAIPNQYGCDSLIITETTFSENDSTFLVEYTCDPNLEGITIDTFFNQDCDSIVVTTTILQYNDLIFIDLFSCNPQDTGQLVEQYTNQWGCDSTVVFQTNLGIDTVYLEETTCYLDEVGSVDETFTNVNGCDSVVITNTYLDASYESYFEQFTCEANQVAIDTSFFTTTNGCDSISILETSLITIDYNLSTTEVGCTGDANGAIILENVSGGIAPYLFAINEGVYQSSGSFTSLEAGDYTIYIQDAEGCTFSDVITISPSSDHTVELGENQIIDFGASTEIMVQTTAPIDTIIWSTTDSMDCINCLNPILNPTQTTIYSIEVFGDNGCIYTDNVTIFVERNHRVYIPSAFSPNGDGLNDSFMLYSDDNVTNINSFQVFTRWGECVFDANNLLPSSESQGWKGINRGKELKAGVYIYTIEVEFIDGHVELFSGDVSLIR